MRGDPISFVSEMGGGGVTSGVHISITNLLPKLVFLELMACYST